MRIRYYKVCFFVCSFFFALENRTRPRIIFPSFPPRGRRWRARKVPDTLFLFGFLGGNKEKIERMEEENDEGCVGRVGVQVFEIPHSAILYDAGVQLEVLNVGN